ncbi:unnamed protein product [Arabidopsis halleri]
MTRNLNSCDMSSLTSWNYLIRLCVISPLTDRWNDSKRRAHLGRRRVSIIFHHARLLFDLSKSYDNTTSQTSNKLETKMNNS